jgi:hypothetical protein
VAGRAVCSSRIPGEDPGGDGPGMVLMSSFGVEILRPRRRPKARPDLAEGVVDAKGAAAPFNCQDPSLQDRVIL